ncbi:MAG: iron export ABC transporter permease subunit FetB [Thermoplasmata archaeon]|nr:iron export ABC transporter permease subunit FetB [Thermoplasmata archaeon]
MSGIPYTAEEALIRMALVAVLIVIATLLLRIKRIGMEKEYLYALLKGGVQIFALAIFLTYLFSSPIWYLLIWILLLAMVVVGGRTSAKRATGLPKAESVTTPSILAGAVTVITILVLSGAMPLAPQFIIPLSGMVFGNSMTICSLTVERFLREMKLGRERIETALSLGIPSRMAMESYGREAVKAAIMPTVDRLKTLGVIFIPGAMTGLLMAGTDPIVAAEYQMIVYFMITGGGVITSLTAVYLLRKRVFTEAEQLAEWV